MFCVESPLLREVTWPQLPGVDSSPGSTAPRLPQGGPDARPGTEAQHTLLLVRRGFERLVWSQPLWKERVTHVLEVLSLFMVLLGGRSCVQAWGRAMQPHLSWRPQPPRIFPKHIGGIHRVL